MNPQRIGLPAVRRHRAHGGEEQHRQDDLVLDQHVLGLQRDVVEGAQDISFAEMDRLQDQVRAVVASDPDIMGLASTAPFGGQSVNIGRIISVLKPHRERKATADEIIARLRPQLAKITGVRAYMQAAQDIVIGARAARTQYQYTLQDVDVHEDRKSVV